MSPSLIISLIVAALLLIAAIRFALRVSRDSLSADDQFRADVMRALRRMHRRDASRTR